MEWLLVVAILTWILPSIAVGMWAESRGKIFLLGFLVSFFVSPIIGAILIAAMPNERVIIEPRYRNERLIH
jgi:hypothetical protein